MDSEREISVDLAEDEWSAMMSTADAVMRRYRAPPTICVLSPGRGLPAPCRRSGQATVPRIVPPRERISAYCSVRAEVAERNSMRYYGVRAALVGATVRLRSLSYTSRPWTSAVKFRKKRPTGRTRSSPWASVNSLR